MSWLDNPCNICGANNLRDGYFVYAIKIGSDGMPTNLVACRSCFPRASVTSGSFHSRYVNTENNCLYCGKTCEGRFCSERCSALHASDLRPLDPLSPVNILVNDLRTVNSAIPVPAQDALHTPREIMSDMARSVARNARTKARIDTIEKHADKINPFVPTNEMGVVFMFGAVADRIGWRMAYLDGKYPDGVVVNRSGQRVKIEFEYEASSFVQHGHDPQHCDVVICWTHDRSLPVPVLALSRYYNQDTGNWDFSTLSLTAH